jgi:hypothetical protein
VPRSYCFGGKMPQISPFVRNHSWALAKPPQEHQQQRQQGVARHHSRAWRCVLSKPQQGAQR